MIISLSDVSKTYNQGQATEVRALSGVSLTVAAGSMVCLRGASGSGKSTLLAVIGCILPPTSGVAVIAGEKISRLPDRFRTLVRRRTIGFIFQHFNLLPELSVEENVALPLVPLGLSPAKRRQRATTLLERFGIAHRARFAASQVSGGELQRAAIARALILDPPILIADEPTAHLDSQKSEEFMALMDALCKEGKTVVIASHDPLVTSHAGMVRIFDIRDGRLHAP